MYLVSARLRAAAEGGPASPRAALLLLLWRGESRCSGESPLAGESPPAKMPLSPGVQRQWRKPVRTQVQGRSALHSRRERQALTAPAGRENI